MASLRERKKKKRTTKRSEAEDFQEDDRFKTQTKPDLDQNHVYTDKIHDEDTNISNFQNNLTYKNPKALKIVMNPVSVVEMIDRM